ncbi:MAG TPA: hypothetical protein VMT75_11965 [Candidatus Saccharimonadales bacterium]|nr:hypothetical protein [Candidatus Saccharimonadales bacterium]
MAHPRLAKSADLAGRTVQSKRQGGHPAGRADERLATAQAYHHQAEKGSDIGAIKSN